MPRVAAITGKSDVAAQHHDVVDHVLKVFGNIRGPFSVLLHSPKLAEKLLGLGDFYRDDSIVASKDRSLAILVGVRERKAAYVWAAQVNAARRAGVREEAIDVIRKKGDPGKLPAEEREIVAYAEQLFGGEGGKVGVRHQIRRGDPHGPRARSRRAWPRCRA